jgi:DnaJ-class molecular chaperone
VTVDFSAAIEGSHVSVSVPDGREDVTVRIPPGAGDGDKVRVPSHGAPGQLGGPAGDLILTIRIRPHEHFKRDGLDLNLELPITVAEAYNGAKVRVPTPSGEVTLSVPKGAQSGQRVRLKGKGVKRQAKVGDLYVRFMVQVPTSDAAKVKKAIDTLAEAEGDVREKVQY